MQWPENIIPLFRPPHCIEVNPFERLWQVLKRLWKGENFSDLTQLRRRLSQELQGLTLKQMQSLTGFNFILEELLAAQFQHTEPHAMHAYIELVLEQVINSSGNRKNCQSCLLSLVELSLSGSDSLISVLFPSLDNVILPMLSSCLSNSPTSSALKRWARALR